MNLAEILTPETVLPDLKAKDRWQAIEELLDALIAARRVEAKHRETIVAALRKREQTMSTGIGFGVGIPHATTDCCAEVVGAFGRSAAGIEFAAMDNRPVQLLVLFLSPQGQVQKHLQVLANISKFLHDKKFRDQLLRAKNAAEILGIITTHCAR